MSDLSRAEVGPLIQREAEDLILGTALLFLVAGSLWAYFAMGQSLFDPSLLLSWFMVQGFSVAALRFKKLERAFLIGSFFALQVHFYVALFQIHMPFIPAAPIFFMVSVLTLTAYRTSKLGRAVIVWALAWASVFFWLKAVMADANSSFFSTALVMTFAINTCFLFVFFWTSNHFGKLLTRRIGLLGPHNRFDEQRIHASKLQSLGELSASLLHEINNPVVAIMGYTHQIKCELKENATPSLSILETANDRIKHNADRIVAISKVMRIHSRDSTAVALQNVSLRDVVLDTITLIQFHLKSSGIQFTWQEPGEQLRVKGNLVELSQLLVNLLNNARDACETSAQKKVRLGHSVEKGVVKIWVEDSGSGIDASQAEQIFRPFYTTKALGKGTGLGLSICQLIAERHHARLYFEAGQDENGQARGTKFIFEIKMASEIASPLAA